MYLIKLPERKDPLHAWVSLTPEKFYHTWKIEVVFFKGYAPRNWTSGISKIYSIRHVCEDRILAENFTFSLFFKTYFKNGHWWELSLGWFTHVGPAWRPSSNQRQPHLRWGVRDWGPFFVIVFYRDLFWNKFWNRAKMRISSFNIWR